MKQFELFDGKLISEKELGDLDEDGQIEVMKTWFGQNYEDPAERTPYESREGGYIWIWGGPYDAREELYNEFSGLVPNKLIEQVAQELEDECLEWAPVPTESNYDEYFVDDIADITEYYKIFNGGMGEIEELLKTNVEDFYKDAFLRLLYANVITVLESFLSNAFINTLLNSKDLFQHFVETTEDFCVKKIKYSDIIKEYHELESNVKVYLFDIVWHNLSRAKAIYSKSLNVKFPNDLSDIFRAIKIRHDIVHRNGVSKDGVAVVVSRDDIVLLIGKVKSFVLFVDEQLCKLKHIDD